MFEIVQMDPLSDVLALLKPRSYVSAALDAGGKWSIQFPQHDGIKFNAVIAGECWLFVEGVSDTTRLETGDCFLLPHGRPFRLASDMSLPPTHAYEIYSTVRDGIASCNGGGDFFVIGSHFDFAGSHADILLRMLPAVVHIRKESDKAALRWYLDLMMQEARERRPGGSLVTQHLAHMMLVQALRLHLAEGLRGGVGWLFALADKQMGAAINAIHADPAHRWTLPELARRTGMSRSIFAEKFKRTVGVPAMEYLTRWRMLLAGERLINSSDTIYAIALSLGYESAQSFSTAFKRVMGCSPRQYSRVHSSASASHSERLGARAGSNLSQAE
jgi:AraC-like DNA-binding protein